MVMMKKTSNRWLGLLGAAVIVSAVGASSDSYYSDTSTDCSDRRIGDGYCDNRNNNELCSYDGGDCCECTCAPSFNTWDANDNACSHNEGFACIDPEAPCVHDDDVTADMAENCGDLKGIGNGFCDDENNKAECNYDGGDCCECTCDPGEVDVDDDYICNSQFACIDPAAPCVDDDSITLDMFELCESITSIGNGWCDNGNNIPECNYDGGDCCECTCDSPDHFANISTQCTEFACVDPAAECSNDDDVTIDMVDGCGYVLGRGNGFCDSDNNNELCGYDGGDCCSCTCEVPPSLWDDDYACGGASGPGFDCKDPGVPCFGEELPSSGDDSFGSDDGSMSYEFFPWEQEEILPTVDGAVEAGTKTEVGVTATASDVRPGRSNNEGGCGEEGGGGCVPANSRDGIVSEIESRWSCATTLVGGGGPCQIEYTFAEPQEIVDIQVAFWKGNERVRTLEVHLNGELTHTHESISGPTFNTLGVTASEVSTVRLESIGLLSHEWISLIEVLIFVQP